MSKSKKNFLSLLLVIVVMGGGLFYQLQTRVSANYEYYDDADLGFNCYALDPVVIDTYNAYVDKMNDCGVTPELEESFFEDNFVVVVEFRTYNRRIRSARVNNSLFDDGTTISIKVSDHSSLYSDKQRLYVFEFEEGSINTDDIEVTKRYS